MTDDLIDRIYEAAFVPELWPSALQDIASRANAASGEFQVIVPGEAPRWQATDVTREVFEAFMAAGKWLHCERPQRFLESGHAGFLCDADVLTPEQAARDPVRHMLDAVGLGWQLGTLIAMPSGEIVGLTFERWLEQGRPSQADIAALDRLRPHMARSALVAARLRLARAEATASALEAVGLPAAVVSGGGTVLSANPLLEQMHDIFVPRAFGRLALADASANRLFEAAMAASRMAGAPLVRSIPLRSGPAQDPAVIHLLPLRRKARDIFAGADLLVIISTVAAQANVPRLRLLSALFDLTAAEARLAAALSAGKSLKQTAAEMGITFGSARTYLARVFAKTGTSQQSQLVALIKSARVVMEE